MNYQAMADEAFAVWQTTKPRAMAVDTETYGLLWRDKPFCATVSWVHHSSIVSHYIDLENSNHRLHDMIYWTPTIVMHNAKFDIQKLTLVGVLNRVQMSLCKWEDTQTIQHLLDEHAPKKLKQMAQTYLGESTDEDEVLRRVRRELKLTKEDGYEKIPREVLVPYALKDAEYTLRLWLHLHPLLAEHDDLMQLYQREIKLMFVLLDMEAAGMGIDVSYVREKVKEYGGRLLKHRRSIEQITGRKLFEESDLIPRPLPEPVNKRTMETKAAAKDRALRETFNPNSPAQVLDMFLELGIRLESTAVDELKKVDHPLAKALLDMRRDEKIRNTYLKPMLHEVDGNVLHTSYRQNGTVTGRMSSGMSEG